MLQAATTDLFNQFVPKRKIVSAKNLSFLLQIMSVKVN